jgi:hypothetical protein
MWLHFLSLPRLLERRHVCVAYSVVCDAASLASIPCALAYQLLVAGQPRDLPHAGVQVSRTYWLLAMHP